MKESSYFVITHGAKGNGLKLVSLITNARMGWLLLT
jgi:hypothetical protein